MTEESAAVSGSGDEIKPTIGPESFADAPQQNPDQIDLDQRFGVEGPRLAEELVQAWNRLLGGGMVADQFMTQWRAAGLRRPGMVAHLFWPRLRSRVALGIDPPLAHAVVDRLLGYERTDAESRLQITPVEWGVLGFMIAGGLQSLEDHPGPLGPWDLTIDRVGPDPFDLAGLGAVVTWRWRVRVGSTTGSARLWIPESLVSRWLEIGRVNNGEIPELRSSTAPPRSGDLTRFAETINEWRVEAGSVTIDRDGGSQTLVPGRLLLIDHAPLAGTIAAPTGNVSLARTDRTSRRWFPARLESDDTGLGLRLTDVIQHQKTSGGLLVPHESDPADAPRPVPTPETAAETVESLDGPGIANKLTVELGRVNLPIGRLTEFRPGDLVRLDRQGGDPVDLISNGRLIAQGELVQVDTELGVQITRIHE